MGKGGQDERRRARDVRAEARFKRGGRLCSGADRGVEEAAVISPVPKREQPTTTTGMLQCESYSERAACELNTICSWADNTKMSKKSGGLATAMLEALPASKPTPEGPCAGVEALVGNEKRCLKPGDSFKDCPECPEMVVVPAGSFMMGSPASEDRARDDEGPQRKVTIAKPFAVGKFEVTFAEWDACVAAGGCKHKPDDAGLGAGQAAGDQRVVGRHHQGVSALAVAQDRQDLPAADGSGMGVCGACRHDHAVLDGADDHDRPGQLQRPPNLWTYGGSDTKACTGRRRSRSARSSRTPSGSTTCTATCGSGWRTATRTSTQGLQLMARRSPPAIALPCHARWLLVRIAPASLRSAQRDGERDGRYKNIGFRLARTLNP